MSAIAIYGAGGMGREVAAILKALPEWEVVGFYDDGLAKGTVVDGLQVLGNQNDLSAVSNPLEVIVALGDPVFKKRIAEQLSLFPLLSFPTIVHPRAILQDPTRIEIGTGSVICAGCILTTAITIGRHVLLNLNCTIGHDCIVGDYSSVMPGANIAGNVSIGTSVMIGSGSQIVNEVKIGNHAKVGAGAVVIHDVRPKATVVGVPAKETRPK